MADKLSHRIWLIFQISFFDSRALFALSASSCLCSSVSVRLLYVFFPNLNSKSGHWGAEQDLTSLLSHPQHSMQNSFIAINGDVGLSFPFLSLISKFQISFSKSNFDFQFLNWIYHIKTNLSIPKFKFQNKKWKSNFWIVYKKIDFEFVVRIYVYKYNTYTYTLTINIYKYNYTNPSIRLPDYISLTTTWWLPNQDNNKIITNAIYIHLYTYNYIYIITFLKWIYTIPSHFYNQNLTSTNPKKTTLFKRRPHIQNMIQTDAKIPTLNQSPTSSKRTAILIYIWGEISSHIMRVYGGGFRLAIMRVYICGKIFALHNTHKNMEKITKS